MDQCPLCLDEQASSKKISDGFGKECVATSSIHSVFDINCFRCGEYEITDDAIFLLKRCDELRKRAMVGIRGLIGKYTREGKILRINQDMLQAYWRERDNLSD